MTDLYHKVLIRPPTKSFIRCVSPYSATHIVDFPRAMEEYKEFVNILAEEGIDVIEVEPLPDYPDSVFIQDAVVIGNKSNLAVLCRFGELTRRGEERDLRKVLESEGLRVQEIREPGTLEGGDVLVTDRNIIFVGESQRTNQDGIRQFSDYFPSAKVVRVPEQKFIHMPSAVRYLGKGKIIVGGNVVDKSYFAGFADLKIIEMVEDLSPLKANDAFRAYMLPLPSGTVLLPPGNTNTYKALVEEGFRPKELDFFEFWKCNGSYMCLISPFYNVL
ncbi:MAG: arginine deiminase-related protein [Conexivisphaerales archaeon]